MVMGFIIIFGEDMNSSVHNDNEKKDISILGKGPTQGLDNTKLNAEKEYSINFNEQQKIFCLSLHFNRVNHDLFVNCVETFKLKARDSVINSTPSFLGNVLKDFSGINLKKTVLYGYFYDFSVDYDSDSNVIRTHNHLVLKRTLKHLAKLGQFG